MDTFKELAHEMLEYYSSGRKDKYLSRLMQNLKRLDFINGALIRAYTFYSNCALITIDLSVDSYSTEIYSGEDLNCYISRDRVLEYFTKKLSDLGIGMAGVISNESKQVLIVKNLRSNTCWADFGADIDFNQIVTSLHVRFSKVIK